MPCTGNGILDLETASLNLKPVHYSDGWRWVLCLSLRCSNCESLRALHRELQSVDAYTLVEGDGCTTPGCKRKRLTERATVCASHFWAKVLARHVEEGKAGAETLFSGSIPHFLRKHHVKKPQLSDEVWEELLSICDTHKSNLSQSPSNIDTELESTSRQSLVFIDTEFYSSTTGRVLTEFSVYDSHGRSLLTAYINWQDTVGELPDHQTPAPLPFGQYRKYRHVARAALASDLSEVGTRQSFYLTLQEAAAKLKECGVGPQTWTFEWSAGGVDTHLLHQTFERYNCPSVIDPSRSIPMIPRWKVAFPQFKKYGLELNFR